MNTLVSIVVPAYNCEKTIERCVSSITKQTYKSIEIIIIDDGSEDGTYACIQSIAKSDCRIKIIKQNNKGASAARNCGINNSTGEYIMFVDSDDWIEMNCVSAALTVALENKADIVMWNAIIVKGEQYKKNTPIKGDFQVFSKDSFRSVLNKTLSYESDNPNMLNISITGPVCKLFSKSCIQDVRFPEKLSIGEDLCFLLRVFPNVSVVTYMNQYFYYIQTSEGSLSQKSDINFAKRKKDFVNEVITINNTLKLANNATLSKFIYYNYLTVVERCLFDTFGEKYKRKVELIIQFIEKIDGTIDYSVIRHKCKLFLRYKIFFPLFIIGKLIRNR